MKEVEAKPFDETSFSGVFRCCVSGLSTQNVFDRT
jgi:hypothetical protein